MDISVVLPSLNPDDKLLQVINNLISHGFDDIIVVNDGSDEGHLLPFSQAKELSQVTVLEHSVNKGKGRALKTAFSYFLENRPEKAGVITVDGDNQHQVEDIIRCSTQMIDQSDYVILGARDFSQSNIPARSQFGNKITSLVFKVAVGINISDTQTGLRAIPRKYLSDFLNISGERFEYETNMLLDMKSKSIPFKEVKIRTVYIENNATSHFNPIVDSIKIYTLILKFLFSSLVSSMVDIGLFAILTNVLSGILFRRPLIFVSTFSARVVSSLLNFTINHKAVFKTDTHIKNTIFKYYILCAIQMVTSFGLVYIISSIISANGIFITLVKIVVDTLLYFISFQIQREWVFKNKKVIRGEE